MKSIKFSEQEVELLIAMYEDELKEVTDYTDRLKETLTKLRNEPVIEKAVPVKKEGKKRGRKPKAATQPVIAKPGKKRGRKPKVKEAEKPEMVVAPKVTAEKAPKKKKARKPSVRKVVARKPAAKAKVAETPVSILPVV